MIYLITIISILIIVLIHTLFLRKRISDSTINWWDSLVSTFISVLLAIVVGIWLFEYGETRTNQNKKDSYRNLLSSELSDTSRILSTGKRMTIKINENNYPVLITHVQPIIIEDAARSGLFNEIITENMLHLARKMKIFNIKTEYVLARMASGRPPNEDKFEENMQNAIKNIDETKESIVTTIDLLVKQLAIDLSRSIEKDK